LKQRLRSQNHDSPRAEFEFYVIDFSALEIKFVNSLNGFPLVLIDMRATTTMELPKPT
jgi:hypothetical protein